MNLQLSQIQNFVKQRGAFVALNLGFLLLCIFVVTFLWNSYDARKQIETPNLPTLEQHTGTVTLEFTADAPEVPTQVETLQIESYRTAEEVLPSWGQKLGMTVHPRSSQLYGNTQTGETMSHLQKTEQISYAHFSLLPEQAPSISEDSAKQAVFSFLDQLGLNREQIEIVESVPIEVANDSIEESFEPTTPDKAIAYEFRLQQQRSGIPIIPDATSLTNWRFLASDLGVLQATFHGSELTTQPLQTYQTLRFPEVLAQVRAGNFTIVGTFFRFETRDTILQITANSARLEYRRDQTNNILVPVWRFDGTATLRSGEIGPISLVTSAIPTRPATP